jgi:predicted transposase YbfD/YdcC
MEQPPPLMLVMTYVSIIRYSPIERNKREIIAIDGKTVWGHFKAGAGGKTLHIVSAWAMGNRLLFGQVKVEDKSNEITAILTPIERHPDWKTIWSIGVVESSRDTAGKTKVDRLLLSSLLADAEHFARGVRSHWGSENSLHYVLDVAFGEDDSRLCKDNGPENMTVLRKLALTTICADTETKSSIIGQRKQMTWSNECLERLLFSLPLPLVQGNLYALTLQ